MNIKKLGYKIQRSLGREADLVLQRLKANPLQYIYIPGVILCAVLAWSFSSSQKVPLSSDRPNLDTYIPEGFVLVPIEVKNYESLDLVIGKFGVVDLYQSSEDSKTNPKAIAKAIKIVRSPIDPSRFAVLSPEDEAHSIVKHPGPFQVTVQNPKEAETRFIKEKKKKGRRIIIGGEQ